MRRHKDGTGYESSLARPLSMSGNTVAAVDWSQTTNDDTTYSLLFTQLYIENVMYVQTVCSVCIYVVCMWS